MAIKLFLVGLVAAFGLAALPQGAMADGSPLFAQPETIAAIEALETSIAEDVVRLGGSCKTVHEQVGACSVSFKVCGKLSKFKWKYDCTACASGKCASAGGFKSGKGAAEEAARRLFTAPFPACAIPAQHEAPVALKSFDETVEEEIEEAAVAEVAAEPVLGGSCKTVHEQVGACSVSFKVCGKLSKFKWKYDCTACASGKCASAGGFKSGKGAAEEAARRLFTAPFPACAIPAQHEAPVALKSFDETVEEEIEEAAVAEVAAEPVLGGSCKTVTEQIATCSVTIKVCGGFHRWQLKYTATACASGVCASSGHTKSPTSAAKEAATKLFALAPACAIPAQVKDAPPAMKAAAPLQNLEVAVAEEPVLGGSCKTVHEQVGACSVSFKVCGGIHRWQWKYDCTACASGKCASASGHKSGKGAAEAAAKKLFTAPFPACAIPAQ